jgi:type VI secretion system protein ImpH
MSDEPPVFDHMLEKGYRFAFLQAMRLLRHQLWRTAEPEEERRDLLEKRVRIRPELSLAFPATDIATVETYTPPKPPPELTEQMEEAPPSPEEEEKEAEREYFRITARFLGLYGESSPLPVFYTEDLIDESREDRSVNRDFIDIINDPLYHLYYRVMTKYRPHLTIGEERDPRMLDLLFCMLGLGTEELRSGVENPRRLLRFSGLFTQFPRSSAGLKSLLASALEEPSIRIEPCVPRRARVPEDQRLRLGGTTCRLGLETCLGEEMPDRMGKYRIHAGPLDAETFHDFLPVGERYQEACFLVQLYLVEPLEGEMEVCLAGGEARPLELGGERWSRLGWNTWVFSGEWDEEGRTRLNL